MSVLYMDSCAWSSASKFTSGSFAQASQSGWPSGYIYFNGSGAKDFTAKTELFTAYRAMFGGTTATANTCIFAGDAGATSHVTIRRNTSRQIEVLRGATVIATGTTVIPDNTTVHIQARVIINSTTGVVQVRLNGLSTNEIDFSGNTKNGGTNSSIDRVTWAANGTNYYLSDLLINDTASPGLASWPGDCAVRPLVVNGTGVVSAGAGSDGNSVNNFQLVDELPNNTTDYVDLTNDGDADSYTVTDLPAGTSTVHAVQVSVSAAKTDAGVKTVKTGLRSGGTNYLSSSHVLSTTAQGFTDLWQQDPATSAAWTGAGVNGVEVRCEAASS